MGVHTMVYATTAFAILLVSAALIVDVRRTA
jgi:hypothetical protein